MARLIEVSPHGGQVQRPDAQRTRERPTAFGKLQALRVGMHPGAPTRKGASAVDDRPGRPGVVGHRHHP
ncbi:hypothetical protein N867_13945 [Actinotalea fermentans ATCC 43279 = JCM 9966 = DSM 3133]|nr:hypothetical protein N867_13945 [Actinotalea fermentans ATCC 43279 = JCM 9966 = DSM 3133]